MGFNQRPQKLNDEYEEKLRPEGVDLYLTLINGLKKTAKIYVNNRNRKLSDVLLEFCVQLRV
jgi:sRNA-binding regulator protein Hfq